MQFLIVAPIRLEYQIHLHLLRERMYRLHLSFTVNYTDETNIGNVFFKIFTLCLTVRFKIIAWFSTRLSLQQ